MRLDFLTQTAIVMDPVAISDNEHSDHQFWIDRGTANLAVKGLQLAGADRQARSLQRYAFAATGGSVYRLVELKLIK